MDSSPHVPPPDTTPPPSDDALDVVIIGAGIAGLGAAICLADAGVGGAANVTIIEQDPSQEGESTDDAFRRPRRGAPQSHHSHAFLARLRCLLRDRHPEVLNALYAAGVSDFDLVATQPSDELRQPCPDDDELLALAARRTTVEWALRHFVEERGLARLTRPVRALGFVGVRGEEAERPTVRGVSASGPSGEFTIGADLVIVADGRRSGLVSWASALGATIHETESDTGITYFSRFYRLRPGVDYPSAPMLGGDFGYLKYGVFPGDDRTFSITLAALSSDDHMRRVLMDPADFNRVSATIEGLDAYVDGAASEAITPVQPMGGLINRRRSFLDEDHNPVIRGVVAIGDAHTCTNPLYGRGCTLAWVQAQLLADALVRSTDLASVQRQFERASSKQVRPWYEAAVAQDSGAAALQSEDESARTNAAAMRTFFLDGVLAAARLDRRVNRAFLRTVSLLDPPQHITSDPDLMAVIAQTFAERDQRDPVPPLGPATRDEMFERLGYPPATAG